MVLSVINRLVCNCLGDSKAQRASTLCYWSKSYCHFAEWVDFAHCIGGAVAVEGLQSTGLTRLVSLNLDIINFPFWYFLVFQNKIPHKYPRKQGVGGPNLGRFFSRIPSLSKRQEYAKQSPWVEKLNS